MEEMANERIRIPPVVNAERILEGPAMSSSESIRAVVVDDSAFMRTVISDILEDGGIEVVAQAKDGDEAIRVVGECQPDVVTMDVEMPGMDGVRATEELMRLHPTPILMLSAHTEEDASVTFDALQNGAVDFFTKPGGEVSIEMSLFKDRLVEMVRTVSQARVRDWETSGTTVESEPKIEPASAPVTTSTAIIGASTGGPAVVEEILSSLPHLADLRLIIVQHMLADFTARFADRLDDVSGFDIREATSNDRLRGGEGIVAPGGSHLSVDSEQGSSLSVGLNDDPPIHGVRPAIDVTMETAAEVVSGPLVGVLLTGMGTDGTAGLRAIGEAGGWTLAQDRTTSAIYGMPRRASEAGVVNRELPTGDIPQAMVDAIAESASSIEEAR